MKTTKISWFQHLCKILLVLRSHVGEEDSGKSNYFCTFPAMISDWRLKFHAGTRGETDLTFPFGFVQVRNSTKIFSLTIRNRQFIFQFEKRTWFYVCFFFPDIKPKSFTTLISAWTQSASSTRKYNSWISFNPMATDS